MQLHAPQRMRELDEEAACYANDPMRKEILKMYGAVAGPATGYGMPHPYPAMMAASVALFGLILAVNLVGDAVRDVLDPRTLREHR